MEEAVELFKSIGLPETKARETAKNVGVSSTLTSLISQVQDESMCMETVKL